jgi:hypothetical protein
MIGVEFKQKRFFFDRALVASMIGKANAKALSRHGAFVQRRARSSMRRRKGASAPGTPPSAHSRDAVRSLKNIWFAYDPHKQSVVIGPLRLNGEGGSVPALHEHGGIKRIRQRPGRGKRPTTRVAHYPARPFMGPAGQAELAKDQSGRLWRAA